MTTRVRTVATSDTRKIIKEAVTRYRDDKERHPMTVTIDHLTPIEKTLLITLTSRALDARTNRPLLGDRLADKVHGRLGFDVGALKLSGTVKIAVAVRSRMLDRIVGGFIAAHPNAVVVELGCGLETRMHRLSPPATPTSTSPACTPTPRPFASSDTISAARCDPTSAPANR
jgi:hypothetical protein